MMRIMRNRQQFLDISGYLMVRLVDVTVNRSIMQSELEQIYVFAFRLPTDAKTASLSIQMRRR